MGKFETETPQKEEEEKGLSLEPQIEDSGQRCGIIDVPGRILSISQ